MSSLLGAGRVALYPRAHWYFAAALLIAVAGFFPSFFQRLGETDTAHLVHGWSAFAWMSLLIVQSWLIHHGQRVWHRRVGRASFLAVVPLVVAGVLMMRSMLRSEGEFERAFGPQLVWIDLTTLSYFTVAYVLALVYRRQLPLHARLMVSTVVLVLPPAVARLLLNVGAVDGFPPALHLSMLFSEAVALALIVHDYRRWRLHPPHLALLAFLILQHVALFWIPQSSAWLALCRAIAGT